MVIAKKQDNSDSDGDVLTVSSEKSCEEVWLFNSASSFHATPKEWFSSYIEKDGGLAHLGDDSAYRIIGVGDTKFKMRDGREMLLKGVKHVPGLLLGILTTAK